MNALPVENFALPVENFFPPKMLILDDSAFDRVRLRRMLNAAGIRWQLVEVDSIAALSGALDCETFDVAILDHDLPDGTGLEALRRIKTNGRNSHVVSVMVTGNEAQHIAREACKQGCSSCLLKTDLKPDILKLAIIEGLQRARA